MRQIEYCGDLYNLPESEEKVWEWVDRANADKRIDDDCRLFMGILAGLMVRALRTGEGVIPCSTKR